MDGMVILIKHVRVGLSIKDDDNVAVSSFSCPPELLELDVIHDTHENHPPPPSDVPVVAVGVFITDVPVDAVVETDAEEDDDDDDDDDEDADVVVITFVVVATAETAAVDADVAVAEDGMIIVPLSGVTPEPVLDVVAIEAIGFDVVVD
ncbi:hypothetical protein RFI_04975, partial [Reticulomyxa filosa]